MQFGCQYLHAPVPGYEDAPHVKVEYHLNGTAEQYRIKVYGRKWKGRVSPEDFIGEHDAWDIRETYRRLWRDLHASEEAQFIIVPKIANGVIPVDILRYPLKEIISTIPATDLCMNKRHEFRSHEIYASGTTQQATDQLNAVVCDGTNKNSWYRSACVFGFRTTEWSRKPVNGVAVPVTKPLTTDCGCHPDIYRVGRYGKWQKSYLVHKTYPEVTELLSR
jgi:hypothetical protein